MSKDSPSAMKHSRSTSDLRPSRKFMSMVNKVRHLQRTQQNSDSHSERAVLQNVINNTDRLSHHIKPNINNFQEIIEEGKHSVLNTSIDSQYKRLVKFIGFPQSRKASTSLDVPRSRDLSPAEESFHFKQHKNIIINNIKSSFQQKIKKLAMPKKLELQRLNDMIGKALSDLNSSKRPRLTLRKTPVKDRSSETKRHKKRLRPQNIQAKIVSILLCLLGAIVIFFVM